MGAQTHSVNVGHNLQTKPTTSMYRLEKGVGPPEGQVKHFRFNWEKKEEKNLLWLFLFLNWMGEKVNGSEHVSPQSMWSAWNPQFGTCHKLWHTVCDCYIRKLFI